MLRTLSVGWDRAFTALQTQYAVGSTDITDAAIDLLAPGRLKHLQLLLLTSGLASGATLVLTIQGTLQDEETGTWTTIKTFTIDEDNDGVNIVEIFECGIYKALRYSVNKTGNSCLNVIDISHRIGEGPFIDTEYSAASTTPSGALFTQLNTAGIY